MHGPWGLSSEMQIGHRSQVTSERVKLTLGKSNHSSQGSPYPILQDFFPPSGLDPRWHSWPLDHSLFVQLTGLAHL